VTRATEPLPSAYVPQNEERLTPFGFLQKYSLFFFFIAVAVAAGMWIWMYFDSVLVPEREYEITEVTSQEETVTTP